MSSPRSTTATKALLLVALALTPASASAQVPLPPLPPFPGQPEPPESQPPPGNAPAPVPTGPGSVALGVNVAHTGHLEDDDLVPPLEEKWRTRGKPLFLLAAERRVYGVGMDGPFALDIRTGRRLWSTPFEVSPGYGPEGAAYDGGILFVTTFDDLHAFDAQTGRLLWRQHLTDVAFAGAPVASGGTVYVTYDQGGGEVLAFDGRTGGRLWSAPNPHGSMIGALDGERLYVFGACGNAVAVRRSDGALVWERRPGCSGGGDAVAVLEGGRVYSSERDYVPGGDDRPPILDGSTGALVGRHPGTTPVFVDGLRIYNSGTQLVARRVADGARVWRSRALGQPIAIGRDIYGFRGNGTRFYIGATDAETGTFLARIRFPLGRTRAGEETHLATAAAPGILLAAFAGRVVAYQSAFRPRPRKIVVAAHPLDVFAGETVAVYGVVGKALSRGGRRVRVEVAGMRGRFHRARVIRLFRDRGFNTGFGLLRNGRVRVVRRGVRSRAVRVYAYPRFRLGRARSASGRRVALPARVLTPHVSLRGRVLVLYLQRHGSKRLRRLDTARLHGRRGNAKATLVFRPPRRVGRRALLWMCVRGQLRLGLGRPLLLSRRCGARTVRHP